MKIKIFPLIPVLILAISLGPALPALAKEEAGFKSLDINAKPDVVLDATPIRVKPIQPGSVSDAIENLEGDLSGLAANVYFQIEDVVEGKLAPVRIEPPSKTSQMKEHFQNKEFLKIIADDTDTTATEFERQRFRVAVKDPWRSFGITSWEKPEKKKYRLFLKRYNKEDDTYILIRSETEEAPAAPASA